MSAADAISANGAVVWRTLTHITLKKLRPASAARTALTRMRLTTQL